MFGFEKLDVWQHAVQFCNQIYSATSVYPSQELFGLTNQTRRAAVSIAQGSGRKSRKDFARFTEIAYGSLMETVSHLRIAKDQRFLSESAHQQLYSSAEELGRMLSGLRASLESV